MFINEPEMIVLPQGWKTQRGSKASLYLPTEEKLTPKVGRSEA
jgi:hypothetical protein